MTLAASEGLAVAPRGSGSALDLGTPPARVDLALDLSRLTAIMEYVPADMVATVQAGVRLDALGRELGKHGQMLALDPYGGLIAHGGRRPRLRGERPAAFPVRHGARSPARRPLRPGRRHHDVGRLEGRQVGHGLRRAQAPRRIAGHAWASSWRRPCAFTPSSPPRARGSSPSPRGRARRRSWRPSSPPASSPIASPGSMPRRWRALVRRARRPAWRYRWAAWPRR